MSLHLNVSVSLPLFPHNHLTPLRACAETSFTPQSSLWQQVLLALTAWPLSNQHLRGFIPLSSPPLFANLPFLFISSASTLFLYRSIPCIFLHISFTPSPLNAALPHFSKTWLVLNIMGKSPSIRCLFLHNQCFLEMAEWYPVDLHLFMLHQFTLIYSCDSQCMERLQKLECEPFKIFPSSFLPPSFFLHQLLNSLYNPYGITVGIW